MTFKHKGPILYIGNYFRSPNTNQNVWFDLPLRMNMLGWNYITTSLKAAKACRLLDMLYTIFRKQKDYRAAQVDVFSGPAFIWAEMSAWLLKTINKPFILNLHGGNLPSFATNHPHRVKQTLKSANVVTSPSAYLKESLRGFCDEIKIIPNPIEISLYRYRPRKLVEPKLVWVRAFHEIYNPSLAPRVLKLLINAWPDIKLTMVGPDKGDGSLQRMMNLAEKLSIVDRVIVVGGVPKAKVPYFLEKGDIFINTTNIDNTPLSVIEAMACGLPIVTTNVGGIPFLVEDDVDGLLVPPNDPEVMAWAIHRIITEPGLAVKLSVNARKKAENYDWSKILPQWESLFNELLS